MIELLGVARKLGHKELMTWGIILGLVRRIRDRSDPRRRRRLTLDAQRFQMRAALCSTMRSRSESGTPSNSSSITLNDFGQVDTGCG